MKHYALFAVVFMCYLANWVKNLNVWIGMTDVKEMHQNGCVRAYKAFGPDINKKIKILNGVVSIGMPNLSMFMTWLICDQD